jgi:transcriptional regulator with XRE-family HTH domain
VQESLLAMQIRPKYPRAVVPIDLGERIARERRSAELSQAELGRRAGVTRETIYRVENGRMPSSRTVFAVEKVLDLDFRRLVRRWMLPADPEFPCIGGRVRRRRRHLRLSLEQVALAAGVSAATLSRFETEQANPRKLVDVVFDAKGDPIVSIRSDDLARCLGFADAAELQAHCEE